jgi:hypothetical protein
LVEPSPPTAVVSTPVISGPVIVTDWTSFFSTCWRKVENAIGFSARWKVVENCQIMTPTTIRTIQNSKLLRVEFNLGLLNTPDFQE